MADELTPEKAIRAALECSVYIEPKSPGLSNEELVEAATRLGFKRGEINEAIERVIRSCRIGETRTRPPKDTVPRDFNLGLEPDYRNVKAFDFIDRYLRDLIREVGRAHAKVPRSVLVSSGIAQGSPEHDIEVAVAMSLITEHLEETDGMLAIADGRETWPLPSAQVAQNSRRHVRERPWIARVLDVVKDIIERRADGRPSSAEPLKAFEQMLPKLGHDRFRIWWSRTAGELGQANPSTMPTTVCVLSAALAEGALTLVVTHARKLGVATLASKTFDDKPHTWSFEDLLKSAAAGGADAIFDQKTRDRADRLNKIRQRIHVGRLMSEIPLGPIPDIRPEEPREARETLDIIVRKILDWLEKHPGATSDS